MAIFQVRMTISRFIRLKLGKNVKVFGICRVLDFCIFSIQDLEQKCMHLLMEITSQHSLPSRDPAF